MEKKKHILFISSWYPHRSDPTHGIFNLYFAKAVALYNKVSVIHVSSDEHVKKHFETVIDTKNGFKEVHVYYKKIISSIPFISQVLKKRKVTQAFDVAYRQLLLNDTPPDLIQINVVLPMGIGAYHLAKKHRLPYVVNENWSGYCAEDGNYKGFFKKYFTKKIIASAAVIMPTSKFLQEAMKRHNLLGDYRVVPNVVNVNLFKPLDPAAATKKTFIHISSLNDKEKNVSGIIRAFYEAYKVNEQIELNIVGEGLDKALYQDMVKERQLSSAIHFKGRLLSADLVHEINKSIALVMFSNYETFCLVNIEAFACGKPVITSSVGAIPEYMDSEKGILVNKNNEKELTEALLKMASQAQLYNAQKLREFAELNFSYERVGAHLTGLYEEVLSKRNITIA